MSLMTFNHPTISGDWLKTISTELIYFVRMSRTDIRDLKPVLEQEARLITWTPYQLLTRLEMMSSFSKYYIVREHLLLGFFKVLKWWLFDTSSFVSKSSMNAYHPLYLDIEIANFFIFEHHLLGQRPRMPKLNPRWPMMAKLWYPIQT